MKLGCVLDDPSTATEVSDPCTVKKGRDERHNVTRQSLLLVTCVPIHVNVLRARCASSCRVACTVEIRLQRQNNSHFTLSALALQCMGLHSDNPPSAMF